MIYQIRIPYDYFYELCNTGLDVVGLVKIDRIINPSPWGAGEGTNKEHLYYDWILTFDTDENITFFKLKYPDILNTSPYWHRR